MPAHADKTPKTKSQSAANPVAQKSKGSEPTAQIENNRPEAMAQRELQETIDNSPQAEQAAKMREKVDAYVQAQPDYSGQGSEDVEKTGDYSGQGPALEPEEAREEVSFAEKVKSAKHTVVAVTNGAKTFTKDAGYTEYLQNIEDIGEVKEAAAGNPISSSLGKVLNVAKPFKVPPLSIIMPAVMIFKNAFDIYTADKGIKAYLKLAHSENEKGADKEPTLIEHLLYATRKTGKKLIKTIMNFVLNVADVCTGILSALSIGAASPAWAGVKAIKAGVGTLKFLVEKPWGVWKWFKKTRGVKRGESAQAILDKAKSGDSAALETLRTIANTGGMMAELKYLVDFDMDEDLLFGLDKDDKKLTKLLNENKNVEKAVFDKLKDGMKSV